MTLRCGLAYVAIASILLTSACTGSTGTNAVPPAQTLRASAGPVRTIQEFVGTRVRPASTASTAKITGWIDSSALSDVDDADANVVKAQSETASIRHGAQLLYISDVPSPSGPGARGFVNIYKHLAPASALQLIGTISGLDAPTQITTDRFANVYVVQTDYGAPVLVFKRGATQPFRTLNTAGKLPIAIAVADDGTVYVGMSGSQILVYPPGSNTSTSMLQAFGDGPNQLFLDRDGNLYFDVVVFGEVGGVIAMFPHGSTTPSGSLGFPDSPLRAVLLHDGDMAIEPLSVDKIDSFERGSTTRTGRFAIAFAQAFCLNQAESALYGAGMGTITVYAFPNGTSLHSLSIGGVNDVNFGCAASSERRLPKPF
jgi:hypothetical protein